MIAPVTPGGHRYLGIGMQASVLSEVMMSPGNPGRRLDPEYAAILLSIARQDFSTGQYAASDIGPCRILNRSTIDPTAATASAPQATRSYVSTGS